MFNLVLIFVRFLFFIKKIFLYSLAYLGFTKKPKMMGLSDSEGILMIGSAVLTQSTRVTDGQTDSRTELAWRKNWKTARNVSRANREFTICSRSASASTDFEIPADPSEVRRPPLTPLTREHVFPL